MSNFIVYNSTTGKILRTGNCPPSLYKLQVRAGESILIGKANDYSQKVSIDDKEVVNKTPAEIEADNPTPVEPPEGEKQKHIKNKEWKEIKDLLEDLEKHVAALERP